jgi:7-keto-8-aminopelargonate synthetase-like enzyme
MDCEFELFSDCFLRSKTINLNYPMDRFVLQGPVGAEISVEGKRYLFFGGTDYLGMAGRPELARGAEKAVARYGISSSSSRISIGTTELHLELEKAISRFAGTEDAVAMATGYMGMEALLAAVFEKDDTILIQHNAHSSIREAVAVRTPSCLEFKIEDLGTLESALKNASGAVDRIIVVAEGVSPLFGTVFPLPEVLKILGDRDSLVLLDDAHAFGVLGQQGRGTAEFHGCTESNVHSCATMSKAFGAFGGCVPGTLRLTETLRERSLAYQGATPPPAPVVGAALASFEYLEQHPELLKKLKENAGLLKQGLAGLGLPAENPEVPIAPLCLASTERMQSLCKRLLEQGILAPFSTYPGSPEGGMIRLAVSAGHTPEQIGFLLECLGKFI